jgi:hypothetical protein
MTLPHKSQLKWHLAPKPIHIGERTGKNGLKNHQCKKTGNNVKLSRGVTTPTRIQNGT